MINWKYELGWIPAYLAITGFLTYADIIKNDRKEKFCSEYGQLNRNSLQFQKYVTEMAPKGPDHMRDFLHDLEQCK